MRSRSTKILFLINTLLFALAACQPQVQTFVTATRPASEQTIIAMIQTGTAQAPIIDTATPAVIVVTATVASPPALPQPNEQVTALPTEIVQPTSAPFVPSPVPQNPTSPVPLLTLVYPSTCRAGPDSVYQEVGAVAVGSKYLAIGRNSPTNFFIIALPDGRRCWLTSTSVTQEGNFASLPEMSPPVGSIHGLILNLHDSKPIPNAPIRLVPSSQHMNADENGVYNFYGVPIGEITIYVELANQQPASRTIQLGDGQDLDQINISVALSTPNGRPTHCPFFVACVAATLGPAQQNFP